MTMDDYPEDFGGRGDEPGAWPEPFTPEWRLRMAVAEAELEALLRDQRRLEKDRDRWPRLYTP